MGKQYNKTEKLKRRLRYVKRKREAAKARRPAPAKPASA